MRFKIFISILLCCSSLFAQTVTEASGNRLRDIVEEKFPDKHVIIGATTGAWAFGTPTGTILDREFSYVTPENDFKQWNIHPDPDTWNWKQTDAWVKHIAENNQILRMHCPIGPQCSKWVQEDTRTGKELEPVLREYTQSVCKRYNGVKGIFAMDVVNEIVHNGKWKGPESGIGGWENPWTKIGYNNDSLKTPLYIRYAFEIANEFAPDLKLILNHHEHPEVDISWDMIKATIKYLSNRGLRVDGIGWQAHVNDGWATPENLLKLHELIDWAHDNNLEFHVTEASVWLNNEQTEETFKSQAETYGAILKVILEKSSTGKIGWNTWHIDDGHGWRIEKAPSLFDSNYKAKPAYYTIQKLLQDFQPIN